MRPAIPALFTFLLPDLTDCYRRMFWAAHDRSAPPESYIQVCAPRSPSGIGNGSIKSRAVSSPLAILPTFDGHGPSFRRSGHERSSHLLLWVSVSAQARTGPFLAIDAKIEQSPDQGRDIKRPDLRCRRHRKAHDQGDRAVDAMRGLALVRRPIAGSVHPDGSVRDTHR